MAKSKFEDIFTPDVMADIFPEDTADTFFEALYGDVSEGAYDIRLKFIDHTGGNLKFEFHLSERPGKCIACNLTYGLPEVFSRHPIINVKGRVDAINRLLDGRGNCSGWKLGNTREVSRKLHVIPLTVLLEK